MSALFKSSLMITALCGTVFLTACAKQESTTPATNTPATNTVDTSQPTSQAVAPQANTAQTAPQTATVSQLAQLPNDSLVLLQGQLIKDLGDEKYLFKDSTGEIPVEIDKELWIGGGFVANENVALHAEIDVENNVVKVDVKQFQATIQ